MVQYNIGWVRDACSTGGMDSDTPHEDSHDASRCIVPEPHPS